MKSLADFHGDNAVSVRPVPIEPAGGRRSGRWQTPQLML
jgi:hypothetical protein